MADSDITKPTSIYQRGKTWWIDKSIGGKRYRFSLETPDLEIAKQKLENINPEDGPVGNWAFTNKWMGKRLDGARERSRKRNMPCDLTKKDILDMVVRSGGRCELTGIWFNNKDGDSVRNPWAPSIDRIDSKKPYSKDNCRLVCYAINTAISEWGEDIFKAMINGYLSSKAFPGAVQKRTHAQLIPVKSMY